MVLTKSELIALLQKEVRLLLHLTTKIDPSMLDYRPTPKQRSTLELLRSSGTSTRPSPRWPPSPISTPSSWRTFPMTICAARSCGWTAAASRAACSW